MLLMSADAACLLLCTYSASVIQRERDTHNQHNQHAHTNRERERVEREREREMMPPASVPLLPLYSLCLSTACAIHHSSPIAKFSHLRAHHKHSLTPSQTRSPTSTCTTISENMNQVGNHTARVSICTSVPVYLSRREFLDRFLIKSE
jgi:hypothetical protein